MMIYIVDRNVITESLRRHDAGDRALPRCKLLAPEGRGWVAVDNSSRRCWVEVFGLLDACRWLIGRGGNR